MLVFFNVCAPPYILLRQHLSRFYNTGPLIPFKLSLARQQKICNLPGKEESVQVELEYQLYIGAKPEQVWQALIADEGVRQVFFGCTLRSSFRVGDEYAYVGPGNVGEETVHVYGHVLAFEPGRRFSYTEHPGPSYYENHAELQTRVTFELDPVGECTKLTLTNDNWNAGHPSYDKAREAWPIVISNLKSYVETGSALDLGW
jgi:uncharacterized protein YndB with AHSA1/START domain